MASKTSVAKSLDSDSLITSSLLLLSTLSSTDNHSINLEEFAADLGIELNRARALVPLVQSIANELTGSRIALQFDGEQLALMGNAGLIAPLRFTTEESEAVEQLLHSFGLSDEVRERIHHALTPQKSQLFDAASDDTSRTQAQSALYGTFYQTLVEACSFGVRLRLLYRSTDDKTATERLVDPIDFATKEDAAYLIAWDVNKDEQRTFRLDRIEGVEDSGESVVKHDECLLDIPESLAYVESFAYVRFASEDLFSRCNWDGLQAQNAQSNPDGSITAPLNFSSTTWLFDRVLAAGGDIEIVEPVSLRGELIQYAKKLHV